MAKEINWKAIVFFILIGLLGLSIYYHKDDYSNRRKSFKGEAIGLSTRFKYGRKVTYLQYYFIWIKK